LFAIEKAGLSIGLLNVRNLGDEDFGLPFIEDNEVRWQVPARFLHSDVLVLDGAEDMASSTLKFVTELMTSRTLRGKALPAVKSVVVIFGVISEDDLHSDAPKLSALDNTVSINVR
jgi:hypothetical protein